MSDQIELAPDYYLYNFKKLTRHTLDWYPDFLYANEHEWVAKFEQLEHDSQCLLVRLLSRKGHWFRSDKLNYVEIPSLSSALAQLEQHGFIAINPPISAQTLGDCLLTKAELVTLFPTTNKSLRKEQLVSELSAEPYSNFSTLTFDIIELQNPQVISLLLALFFANTHQDLSQFVLEDLGLHHFENYQLSKTRRFFNTRTEVEQLLQLTEIQTNYANANRKGSKALFTLLDQLPSEVEHKYIERKRQHLINELARDLERLECYEDALVWFHKTALPPSRERQARIYDKLDDINRFSDIVTCMLNQPYDVSELEVANKLEQRLKRKQGQRVPRHKKPTVAEYHLELDLSGQRVELAVKEHFEQLGYQVFYCENLLLNGLFGLAFWDAIFAPIEGAFINQYQHRPLDLYHSDFSEKRSCMIARIFEQIEQNGLMFLHTVYEQKYNIANPFVHWSYFTKELLDSCIKTLPNTLVIELFKVMLKDIKLYRNGMPDLMLFKEGNYEWVEVKGPGDKLQDNQWRWINEFRTLNVDFAVCYVRSLEL
ncbi:VRR-NUC domain-containing protein [Vibrio sp. TBV020]|uniref:VRR-NUC domain-containing protein n=1 Tax=Vibrio sp. TBV020 TaxID=3137398 RepID=UPI0038CD629F